MPTDSLGLEEIAQQLALLDAHRQRLAVYLGQVATLDAAHAPPGVLTGIAQARTDIARVKAILGVFAPPPKKV